MSAVTLVDGAARPRASLQLRALVARNIIKTVRVPQLLMFSMAMPLTMLVLFSQVFRSIASSPAFPSGVDYIDFITPALLAISTVMSGTNSGVAIATDSTTGVFDRFTSLPLDIRVVYLARALTDLVLTAVRVVVLLAAAWLFLGFDFSGGPAELAALIAVLLPLSFAMSWLFLLVGTRLGHPEVVQFAGMMLMMPFMFLSSAFAPLATMPAWLRTAATANPVTHTIDAARSIALGHPDAGAITAAVLSAALLASVTAGAITAAAASRRGRPPA
jgi:ABC-2 type transport system permease protein